MTPRQAGRWSIPPAPGRRGRPRRGSLLAWDPVKAEPRWAVPFALPLNGGVLSTDAGLVFQGNKFGDLVAYDAETGEQLWSHRLVVMPPRTDDLRDRR
ncbi:MAG: hypothetical protein CM15mP84_03540 [Cellvibrionales bacterium]|nr:MAG: hypothetical protein CM15mP84_03540 [Cellvibrionales bacterium]